MDENKDLYLNSDNTTKANSQTTNNNTINNIASKTKINHSNSNNDPIKEENEMKPEDCLSKYMSEIFLNVLSKEDPNTNIGDFLKESSTDKENFEKKVKNVLLTKISPLGALLNTINNLEDRYNEDKRAIFLKKIMTATKKFDNNQLEYVYKLVKTSLSLCIHNMNIYNLNKNTNNSNLFAENIINANNITNNNNSNVNTNNINTSNSNNNINTSNNSSSRPSQNFAEYQLLGRKTIHSNNFKSSKFTDSDKSSISLRKSNNTGDTYSLEINNINSNLSTIKKREILEKFADNNSNNNSINKHKNNISKQTEINPVINDSNNAYSAYAIGLSKSRNLAKKTENNSLASASISNSNKSYDKFSFDNLALKLHNDQQQKLSNNSNNNSNNYNKNKTDNDKG